MHEASIAESIIKYLIDYERKNSFRISSVTIEIGRASGVSIESLAFCLGEVSKIMNKNWTFNFLEKPLLVRCDRCNIEYEMEELKLSCKFCNEGIVNIISGYDLNIYELEGEEVESKSSSGTFAGQ